MTERECSPIYQTARFLVVVIDAAILCLALVGSSISAMPRIGGLLLSDRSFAPRYSILKRILAVSDQDIRQDPTSGIDKPIANLPTKM